MKIESLMDTSKIRGGYGKARFDNTYENLLIKFKNGSVIESISTSESVVRGKGVEILEINEEEI